MSRRSRRTNPSESSKPKRLNRGFGRGRLVIGLCTGALTIAACSTQEASRSGPEAPAHGTVQAPVMPSPGARDFVAFESGPVRPIAKSPDGTKLFVTNTPDNHLEIYDIDASGNLSHAGSVRVGLEPVAVAARNAGEVWVVNHLSDSVSIVDVASTPPRVTRTLLVGDEPRDLVFAANGRAFITTAHRGQNRALLDGSRFTTGMSDPQLATPSMPRADVWVFDPASLGTLLGGDPVKVVELFGDTPRALAVNGDTVYAAVFNSGNQTAIVTDGVVCETNEPCTKFGIEYPGGDWGPHTNVNGNPAPHVGLMVKYDHASGTWKDLVGRNWNNAVKFNLPDKDVFAIDATTLGETAEYPHVGTTLFNMAVNPASGHLYVSNTDSQNHLRFEGNGDFAGQTVQGNLARTQITVIAGSDVEPRHLNKHIDYDVRPAPAGTKDHSLATPLEMAVTADGATLYVAAFGSGKVGKYSTAALEGNTFDPTLVSDDHIPVTGGGPAGLVLDESRGKLYVHTRFDNGISVVDTATGAEAAHLEMHNPEPQAVVQGRKFLYDAVNTSSNGEASCASCHIFGDKDELAWDLGNPDAPVQTTQYEIHLRDVQALGDMIGLLEPDLATLLQSVQVNGTGKIDDIHPMKGPMTTQTLRGMQNSGAMHWRGDRSKGFFGEDTRKEPPFDSRLSFKNFIVAFEGLVGFADDNGLPGVIDTADMDRFADFALELFMPPNPIRALDNSLTAAQYRGFRFFKGCDGTDSLLWLPSLCINDEPVGTGHFSDGAYLFGIGERCEGCHVLDPEKGFFGTDGDMSFTALPQITKVPQLRNAYTKVGTFGRPHILAQNQRNNEHQGDQIRGSGFSSNGSVDTLLRFFNGIVFNKRGPFGAVGFSAEDPQAQRADIVEWVMAFPSDLAPITGQQITLTGSNAAVAGPRIDLLLSRANTAFTSNLLGTGVKECELVASGAVGGVMKSWLWRPGSAMFEPDDGSAMITDAALRSHAATPGQELTFTCVPPGSGVRIALDRDRDGFVNRVDECPADSGCSVICGGGQLDCDQSPDPCNAFTATNSAHYSAGRATRERSCFLIFCGAYQYFTLGTHRALGEGDATTTVRTSDAGASYEIGNCPAWEACEVDGNVDIDNCGACGAVCDYANASETCSAGACVFGACDSDFIDCNGASSDGCEANPNTDVNNCGACGIACSYPNAADVCAGGVCSMGTCDAGFADCNGDPNDGCEADLDANPNHCGACDTACTFANAGADCLAAQCTMGACLDGFDDCNDDPSDGCETPLASDANHCGGCGIACTFANASSACVDGGCQIGECSQGWSNCDGDLESGCETIGACGGGLIAFTYSPSNFDPTDANLAPTAPSPTTTLNCGTSTFNSETLAFSNWCGNTPPSPVAKTQPNGPSAVVLPMGNLVVSSGATLQITGNRPVIVAVYGNASIDGTVDASASFETAGPGGNLWCLGAAGQNGSSSIAWQDGAVGGGGGAFGSAGGSSPAKFVGGASGGNPVGTDSLVPLLGGCQGGYGGQGDWLDGGGRQGGGGGGAVQISVSGILNVTGQVSASGGGGRKGNRHEDGGGGGGSGGGILLEGFDVTLASGAWVTANGGSGASGVDGDNDNEASNGNNGGKATTALTSGGVPPAGSAGNGGSGAAAAGAATAGGFGGSFDDGAGGGGGGHGRIRVNAANTCSVSASFSPAASKSGCL